MLLTFSIRVSLIAGLPRFYYRSFFSLRVSYGRIIVLAKNVLVPNISQNSRLLFSSLILANKPLFFHLAILIDLLFRFAKLYER